MDIKKIKPTRWKSSRSLYLLSGCAFLALMAVAYYRVNSTIPTIERNEVIFTTVERGEFTVQVDGYGILRSNRIKVLTSINQATVKEIFLRPGSIVGLDSVIAVLENPELVHLVHTAEQDVARAKANLRQLKLTQNLEMLQEEANLADLDAQLETISTRRAAEQKLAAVGAVSQLSFQETLANENLLRARIEVQRRRLKGLQDANKEGLLIQEEIIHQMISLLNIALDRQERLEVRADFVGVVQRLSVEEGQSLAPGQEIAMIGSISELVAILRVPQSQAHLVQLGQTAVIDTKRNKLEGVVTRIDPIVTNNTVSIEIALPSDIPSSVRPEQNIEGFIVIQQLTDVFYMSRPAGVRAQEVGELFHVNSDNDYADLVSLEFGFSSGRLIEVKSGAKSGDRFIVSDLTRINSTAKRIKLN